MRTEIAKADVNCKWHYNFSKGKKKKGPMFTRDTGASRAEAASGSMVRAVFI